MEKLIQKRITECGNIKKKKYSELNLINNWFSLKNSRPCQDLNPGPPSYQADLLPIELYRLGCSSVVCFLTSKDFDIYRN